MERLPPRILKELLSYDADTGRLFWRERPHSMFKTPRDANAWNTMWANSEALTSVTDSGYRRGSIFSRYYLAHRVILAMELGYWPHEVDHINGDRIDNRLVNLREVTTAENRQNSAKGARNTSGVVGVNWKKSENRWCARININSRSIHLGLFSDFDDAVKARKEAEIHYGYHPNHGRDGIVVSTQEGIAA